MLFIRCRIWCLLLLTLTLAGCGDSTTLAPVVNGWRTQTGKQSYYTVQKGDTIYSIAWAFNMDYRQLAKINHLEGFTIHPGQKLRMTPHVAEAVSSAKMKPRQQTSRPTFHRKQLSSKYTVIKRWLWPVRGKIVKKYSNRLGYNRGINISGHYGEPIRAAANGKVVYTGSKLRGYGKLIIIKHNPNYLSAYAFNKVILVKEDQYVKAGQKIAKMGKNNQGQTLLHFEIRKNGKAVNPLYYLR